MAVGIDLSPRGIINGALDLVDTVNVFTSNMDEKKESMINLLMDAGYKRDDILDFIDVVRTQAEEYIEEREKFYKWLDQMQAAKKTPRGRKA